MSLLTSILLLDKPLGLSSNAALQRVRWLLGKPKAGHTGTLDPLATGMLPICIGEATRFAGLLLAESKCYRTRIAFGTETASGDRDGEVVAEAAVPALSEERIRPVLADFCGEITQVPPMYSAIKHQGVPLYKLARAGESVVVKPRQVRVDRIELIALGSDCIELEVTCGSGTYIRSLGMDIARALGTVGHLAALRRCWVSPFELAPMASLDEVRLWSEAGMVGDPPWLVPVESALTGFPILELGAEQTGHLKHGRPCPQIGRTAGVYRLRDPEAAFFGLGEVDPAGTLRARRLLTTGH
jgi:tRNA pseudouridine55 synthase